MTKRERFEAIKLTARRMAGEVEECWFPDAPPGSREVIASYLTRMIGSPRGQAQLQGQLEQVFASIDPLIESRPAIQEVEQEAAGLVQAAIKACLYEWRPDALSLRILAHPLATKFKGIPEAMMQAPVGVRVPSLQAQRRFGWEPSQENV